MVEIKKWYCTSLSYSVFNGIVLVAWTQPGGSINTFKISTCYKSGLGKLLGWWSGYECDGENVNNTD